jgi:hypothetical protein
MRDDLYSPSGIELQTTGDAKAALLEWSAQADAELLAQIQDLVGTVKAKARKVTPWAAGAALLAGLLFGRKRKRRRGRDDDEAEPARGGGVRLGPIIKIAFELLPFILPLLRRARS